MKHFINPVDNEVYAYELDGSQDDLIPESFIPLTSERPTDNHAPVVDGDTHVGWEFVDPLSALTPTEIAAEYERQLDEYVDSVAQDFGYRNIDSISKYTATENPFQAECLALVDWVSAFWVAASAMLNQTPTNEPPPSIETVISSLPPPPVKG